MNFTSAVKKCFLEYFTFSGRASRSEYWYFVLFTVVFDFAISAAFSEMFSDQEVISETVSIVIMCIVFMPSLAVFVRRFHDINISAGWSLMIFASFYILLFLYKAFISLSELILVIGVVLYSVVLLLFLCKRGTIGENRFGQDPLMEYYLRKWKKHNS